jgi:hypothetical protein
MSAQNSHSDFHDAYFIVGELTLQVEHDSGIERADLLSSVDSFWQAYVLETHSNYTYNVEALRIVTLGLEGQVSSLIKIPIDPLLEIRGDSTADAEGKDDPLIELVNQMNGQIELPLDHEGIIVQAITPNWILSSMSHSVGHPCPGGKPVPVPKGKIPSSTANQPDSTTTALINTAVVAHSEEMEVAISGQGGGTVRAAKQAVPIGGGTSGEPNSCPVNVIILDTAPTQTEQELLELCNTRFPNQHRLRALLEENRLHIYHAADLGFALPPPPPPNHDDPHYTNRDKYNVSDHGLFIAGIIHTLAPTANIYLVEVLNQFGIGSIESITAGIQAINAGLMRNNTPTIDTSLPLIVNCSLCIGFLDAAELEQTGLVLSGNNVQTMRELESLRVALRSLDHAGSQVRIFASSGNDAPDVDPPAPPDAYCPAAFDFVRGVGATNGMSERAWYSNKSDVPPIDGVLVYGGNLIDNGSNDIVTDPLDAMLSIYVEDTFPDGTTNDNGWAYWAGTSFATGRMSGLFASAAGVCSDISPNAAVDLYKNFVDQATGTSDDDEPILPGK